MAKSHPDPTPATVKQLYANAFNCGHPECSEPLYKSDVTRLTRWLNSRISHICARSENGPRWHASQSAEDNRSDSNLILLCTEHANEIDDKLRVASYPVALLKEWKKKQLADFDRLCESWNLSDDEADEVIRESFHPQVSIDNSVVSLGGQGGQAPSAGGGGGGAIGAGATGGKGGRGGKISLLGTPGTSPGGGGGGGGSIDGKGGDGGEGGKYVAKKLSLKGGDVVKCRVGAGGRPGKDAEDTTVEVVRDGKVIDAIVAKAGRNGGQRRAPLLESNSFSRPAVAADIDSGLRVSTIFLANAVEQHAGLFSVLGGGWEHYGVRSIPYTATWPVVCCVEMGTIEPGTLIELVAIVKKSDGEEVQRRAFTVFNQIQRSVVRVTVCVPLRIEIASVGVWLITIASSGIELAKLPIEVRLLTPDA